MRNLSFAGGQGSHMKSASSRRPDLAGFMVGFSSLWIQVVLIRRLMAAFTGNELTIGAVLASWLLWTGLGSFVSARFSDRITSPASALALALSGSGALTVASLFATAGIKSWMGPAPGEMAGLPVIFAGAMLITAPCCLVLGFAFPLASRMQEDFERAAGRAYRFEALGAASVGLILAAWFYKQAGPVFPGLVIFLLMSASSLLFCGRGAKERRVLMVCAGLLVLAAGLVLAEKAGGGAGEKLFERMYWGGRPVLDSFDSRYGYLAALREGDEITIFRDGAPGASFPDPERDEQLAHLPLSMCATPYRVLLIGGGFSGMAQEILQHPVERLDWVELDPGQIELEKRWAPGWEEALADGRAVVREGDGRAWLAEGFGFYDVIIINEPDPFTAGQNRFYSAEFYGEAREALMPAGVLLARAGEAPPNLMYTGAEIGLLAGVVRTVETSFSRVEVLPLSENLILAGNSITPLSRDPAKIESVLQSRGIESLYASAAVLEPDLSPFVLHRLDEQVAGADVRVDRDLNPRGYLYGIMAWAERTSPAYARLFSAAARLPVWSLLLIPLLVPPAGLIFERKDRSAGEGVLAAGVSGFVGIVVELSLLIAYQVMVGSLYFALTLLTASFMVGLSAGAFLWERRGERSGLMPVEVLLVLWSCAGLVALLLSGSPADRPGGWFYAALFGVLLFGQGGLSGAMFAASSSRVVRSREEVGRGVGLVYGVELLGSALGGLLAGAFLVPVFGIPHSLGAALLAAVALLFHSGLGAAYSRRGAAGR